MASTNPNPPANLTNIQERLSQLTTNANSARQIIENVGRFPSLIGRLGAITSQLKDKVQRVNALAESLQIPAVTQDLSQIQNLADTMQRDLVELAALIPEGSAPQSNTQDQPSSGQPQVGGFFGPFKGMFGNKEEHEPEKSGDIHSSVVTGEPKTGGFVWSKSRSKSRSGSKSGSKTGSKSRKHKKNTKKRTRRHRRK